MDKSPKVGNAGLSDIHNINYTPTTYSTLLVNTNHFKIDLIFRSETME